MAPKDAFYEELAALKARFEQMKPELEVTVRAPETGGNSGVEGYVVVWNTGISIGGPLEKSGKGGTRITPTLTLDEVKMLARIMALKNAAAGLPLGGAKSGLKADPFSPDFEITYRRFVKLCQPFLRENGGPFGGFGFDIGGRPEHALWACDELQSRSCFTGKPLEMGGTDYDREGIAGLGVAVAAETALKTDGKNPASSTFAIQGLGAMGAAVLRYFSETGATLSVFSDPKYGGTWRFLNPISGELKTALVRQDVAAAKALIEQEAIHIAAGVEDALYAEVDVLFPCAVQNVITDDNAERIPAKYVVEGANNPVSESARTKLFGRGITVIPDFIANPGGIIAAFVELTSSSASKAEEAKTMTRLRIAANVKAMLDTARALQIEPAHAGLSMALKKIFQST